MAYDNDIPVAPFVQESLDASAAELTAQSLRELHAGAARIRREYRDTVLGIADDLDITLEREFLTTDDWPQSTIDGHDRQVDRELMREHE